MPRGQPYALAYAEVFYEWLEAQSALHKRLINAHLKRKTSNPEYGLSLDGKIFHTFVRTGERLVWGVRIDYEVTSMTVIVLAGKVIPYPGTIQ